MHGPTGVAAAGQDTENGDDRDDHRRTRHLHDDGLDAGRVAE